jgi:hypothetical protein
MRMREFESRLKKLTTVTILTYGRKPVGKGFEFHQLYVHTGPGVCHLELGSDCMENQLAYFQKLCKKES